MEFGLDAVVEGLVGESCLLDELLGLDAGLYLGRGPVVDEVLVLVFSALAVLNGFGQLDLQRSHGPELLIGEPRLAVLVFDPVVPLQLVLLLPSSGRQLGGLAHFHCLRGLHHGSGAEGGGEDGVVGTLMRLQLPIDAHHLPRLVHGHILTDIRRLPHHARVVEAQLLLVLFAVSWGLREVQLFLEDLGDVGLVLVHGIERGVVLHGGLGRGVAGAVQGVLVDGCTSYLGGQLDHLADEVLVLKLPLLPQVVPGPWSRLGLRFRDGV